MCTSNGSGSFLSSSQVLSAPANPTPGTGSAGSTGSIVRFDFI
jgi:hypothetical protein